MLFKFSTISCVKHYSRTSLLTVYIPPGYKQDVSERKSDLGSFDPIHSPRVMWLAVRLCAMVHGCAFARLCVLCSQVPMTIIPQIGSFSNLVSVYGQFSSEVSGFFNSLPLFLLDRFPCLTSNVKLDNAEYSNRPTHFTRLSNVPRVTFSLFFELLQGLLLFKFGSG